MAGRNVNIKWELVRVPVNIIVDDILYPRTAHNVNIAKVYDKTKDELILDKLVDFSLAL